MRARKKKIPRTGKWAFFSFSNSGPDRDGCNTGHNILAHALINVVYEDDQFMVFDKPSGLLVIPTPKKEQNTLVTLVNQQYALNPSIWKLHPCHRIDRETSGVILFAKGKRYQKIMMEIFAQRKVNKTYIAFVHGTLKNSQGTFRRPVTDAGHRKFNRKGDAVSAITQYRVIEQKKLFSVVEVQPVTGRTNQIRIHFSQAKHPLVGDRKYAFARDYALKFRRTALHAATLAWTHPVTRRSIRVQSALPADMAEFLTNH